VTSVISVGERFVDTGAATVGVTAAAHGFLFSCARTE
jgi:hypothetical protein